MVGLFRSQWPLIQEVYVSFQGWDDDYYLTESGPKMVK